MKRIIAVFLLLMFLLPSAAFAANDENREICYRYITEVMGYNRAVACGILSNIQYESNFRPNAVGDSGNAYGICQWNSRRQSLINYCANNGFESWEDIYGQLGYLNYELENNKKSVGNYLKNIPDTAQGAYDAANYFCVYFEIPADRYNKGVTRGTTAVSKYYQMYGGSVSACTVSYNTMGGSGLPADQTKTEGVPLTLSTLVPVLPGYEFIGWGLDPLAEEAAYAPGDAFEGNTDTVLYALWVLCSYSDLSLSSDEGGYTVIGCTGTQSQINIPSEINGIPVIAIDYGAFLSVTPPASVYVPSSVTYIELDVFPEGVSIVCEAGSAAHAYAMGNGIPFTVATVSGIKPGSRISVLEAGAFDGTNIRALDLSDTRITVIPEGAFTGCRLLSVLTLSSRVTSIADGAIPDGVLIVCPRDSYAHDYAVSHGYRTADGGTTVN